jgi:polysaccharide chain length determinant protein (PEP-CTERM system associated)
VEDNMELPHTEIQKYIKLIGKRKYLFIFASLLIMSFFVWGSFFLPKEYEARSSLFLEGNPINSAVKGIAQMPTEGDRLKMLKYNVLNRAIVAQVLSDLDLDLKARDDRELEDMITDFQKRTWVAARRGLFTIGVRDKDPEVARDYINALVRRYVEENTSSKREDAYGVTRFLTEQVQLFKEKTDKAQEAIIKFRQEKGIYLTVNEDTLFVQIKTYSAALEELRTKKRELIAMGNKIKMQLHGSEPVAVSLLGEAKSADARKDQMIQALEARIKQLLISYTDEHPEILRLRGTIESIKEQDSVSQDNSLAYLEEMGIPGMNANDAVYQDLKMKLFQNESMIEAIEAREKRLLALISEKKMEFKHVPEEKRKLSALEKEKDNHKQIYETLLSRLGQAEFSKQMEIEDKTTTFRIVDPAILPTKHVSPNRVRIILFGIFIGIFGAFGIVFMRESLDTTIKDTRLLKNHGYDVLAVIPKIFIETEQEKRLRKEKFIYATAAGYFLVICFSLIHEIAGLSYIETIISQLKIDQLVNSVSQSIKGII